MRLSLLATIGSAISGPVTNSTLNVTDVSTVTIPVTDLTEIPFVTNSSATLAPSSNPKLNHLHRVDSA